MSNAINIEDYDALVLDCWDTLLHRDVVAPADRFHYYREIGTGRFLRERAESEARIERFGKVGSGEIKLSDYLDIGFEYHREGVGSFQSPSNVALGNAFTAAHKPVFVISDTYMSANQLRPLLSEVFRNDTVTVITSADWSKPKAEGLIGEVLAQYSIDPKRALVIGDNPDADGYGATLCGARYAPYAGYSKSINERLASTNHLAKLHLGRPLRAIHKRQLLEKTFDNPYLELGYALLGPIVAGTLSRIDSDRMVTFVSRDTWLLYELYTGPKQYMCVNREIAIRASLRNECDFRAAQGTLMQVPGAVELVLPAAKNCQANYDAELERLCKHLATLDPLDCVIDMGCRGVTFDLLQRVGIKSVPTLLVALPDSYYPSIAKFKPYTAEWAITDRVSVLETLLKQPVGPLVGYETDGAPIFKAREPGPQCAIVDEIQRGARMFVNDAGPSDQDLEAHLLQLLVGDEPVLVPLINELGPLCAGATLRVDRDRR